MGSTTGHNELQAENFGYFPLTNQWLQFGQLTTPRRFGDGAVYNGKLLFVTENKAAICDIEGTSLICEDSEIESTIWIPRLVRLP